MKSETTKEVEVTAKVSAPTTKVVEEPKKEVRITQDKSLRNQFATAVVPYVLNGMDITFLEGHPSVPRFAEKVFILADALVKEANK